MLICPNLSDPNIRKEFFELEGVVGEAVAYYLWETNNGHSIDKDSKGNRNQLFVDIQDSTGDRAKAFQLTALTFGDNYKNFADNLKKERLKDKLPKLSDLSVLNAYLETNNKTVESLLDKTYKDITVIKSKQKELNNSDKRDIKEEREYRKSIKVTARQQAQAFSWFSQSPISKFINFRVATKIANSNSIAQWAETGITLYRGSDFTDVYHEAWHEFTQSYLTTAERNVIYNEVRNRVGTYNYNGVEIPYAALTRKQVEEVLAEEFRQYMLAVKDSPTPPEPKTLLQRFFNKIVDLFNFIFKGKTKQESQSVVEEWFKALQTGNISAKRNFENNEWTRLNLSKVFTQDFNTDARIHFTDEVNLAIKNGLREVETPSNYADGLYKLTDDTVVRVTNLGNNRYRITPVTTLEFDPIEGAELVSSLNYMFYEALNEIGLKVSDLLTANRNDHKKAVYERMREKLTAYFDERKAMYLADPDSVGNEFVNVFDILNMWDDVRSWHSKFLNRELADYDDMIESALIPEDETERGRDSKDFESKTAADVNPKELADPIIISMLKGLPKIDPDFIVDGQPGIARGSEFMLPLSGDYNTNYNILLNALSGMTVYEDMINKVKELAQEFPQFTYLLNQLPTSIEEAKTLQDLQIVQAFKQAMSLPRVIPWGLRIKPKTKSTIAGDVIVYDMELFELNTTGGAKVKEQLDSQFAIDASRKYRLIDEKTGEAYLDIRSIIEDYGAFFDEFPRKLSVNGKTMYTFLKDVFNMDFTPYANTKKFTNRQAMIQEFAIQMFTRIKLHDFLTKTTKTNKEQVKPILRPLGKLSVNFSPRQLKQLDKMGIPTSLKTKLTPKDKFVVKNIKSASNNTLSLYDDLKQFYGDQSYINIEGELQWGMHQWNELAYRINQINKATTVQELAENLQTQSMVTNGFFDASVYMKKLFAENGKKRKRNAEGDNVELSFLGWQGMSVQNYSDTKRGNKAVDLTPEDKLAYDFFSYLKIRLVENLRFGAKSSAYSIQFKGTKSDITIFAEDQFEEDYPEEFFNTMTGYLRYEMAQIKNAKKDSDRKFVIFDGILSDELKKQLTENALEKKGFREYSTQIREEIRNFFNSQVENHYNALKYSLLDDFLTISPEKQDAKMVEAFKKLFPEEENINSAWIKNKLKFYLANYTVHQIEVVHLFVGNPRNYQTKGKGYKELFKRLGFTSSPGRQFLVEENFFNKLQTLGVTRELEQVATQAERPYNSEIRVSVAKDFGPHANNKESVMKYFEVQILRETEALYGKTSKEYKDLTKKGSTALRKLVETRYEDYANQSKEADAQAWGNLDFIRVYLTGINRWTPQLEEAYKREVEIYRLYKKLKEAPKKQKTKLTSFEELAETTAGDEAKLYDLINNTGIGLFPSLKTGLYGAEKENPEDTILGKFSLHPLLPSVVIGSGLSGTDLADVMESMFESGTDIITFGSGQKMSFPFKEYEIYDKNMKVNKISSDMIGTYSMDSLREQQYIAPKFKEEATLSTQLVKLLFGDFFENGDFSNKYPEEFKGLVENARQAFVESIRHTVELEQLDMAKAMGITLENNKVVAVDKNRFYKWLQKEAQKQDIREDFFNFLQNEAEKENPLSLDSLSYRNVAERIFVSALNKKLIRPKLKGEPYIQTASTGYNKKGTKFKNPTAEQIEKYGVNNLRNYRIENGKVQPADIKIAFNPNKHAALLNLEYKGTKIGNLATLNEALLDDDWVEANKEKITLVGVRIPVQGHNSIEMFRVREFLPTSAGPVMIVNPDIVTKSGSDFDIDKLFMYEPSFQEDGQLFNVPYSKEAYEENLKKLAEKQEVISVLAEQIEALETEMKNNPYFDSYQFYKMIYFQDKEILKKLYNMKLGVNPVRNERIRARINNFKQDVVEAKKAAPFAKPEGELDEVFFTKLNAFNKSYRELREEIKELNEIPKGMLATSHNNFVKAVTEMMSQPVMFESLTMPNNNNYLHSFIIDLYNRVQENQGSSVRYNNVEDISYKIKGIDIFLPVTSTRIQREVIGAKSPLGISAKINAMHKLFQQAGLKFVDPFFNLYYLPAKRDKYGDITLGNTETTDGVRISTIGTQFINGNVDAEKEDWINRIFADKVRTPLFLQMVNLNGTSMEAATILLLQPVMNEFFRDSKPGKFKQAVSGLKGKDKVFGKYLVDLAQKLDPKLLIRKKGKILVRETVINILAKHGNILSNLDFEQGFKKMPPSISNVRETRVSKVLSKPTKDLTKQDKDFLLTQLVALAQYYVVEKQNNAIVALNSNIDFNTTNFQSGQAVFNQLRFLSEGTIEGQNVQEIFNEKALDYIKNESVLSPFNISGFGTEVMARVLNVTGNPVYKTALSQYMESLALEPKFKFLVTGKRGEKFIRDFNDEFILSLLWNFGGIGNQTITQALPRTLFRPKTPESLFDRWKKMKESKEESYAWIMENMQFAKYLTFRKEEIEGKGKKKEIIYYPVIVQTGSTDATDAYTYEILSLVNDYIGETAEKTNEVRKFFFELTMGVLAYQGFKLQRNTLQSVISASITAPYFDNAINTFLPYLNSEKGSEKNEELKNYFKKFFKRHYEQMTNKLPNSPYMKDYGKEEADKQLVDTDYSYQEGSADDVYDYDYEYTQEGPEFMESFAAQVASTQAPVSEKAVADIPQNKVSGVESFGSKVTANAEAIKALGSNPHSIDMIEAGFRTRTTRSESEMAKYAVKVGDTIKHFGKSADGTTKNILAKVTAIHPKGSPGWKGTWNKEGWRAEDVNVIDRFKDGAAAIEFEVIKPTTQALVSAVKPGKLKLKSIETPGESVSNLRENKDLECQTTKKKPSGKLKLKP